MDSIVTLISTVGFPIACCFIMFYVIYKMNEQHREEMKQMTDAINNNTQALIKLADSIGVDIE